MADQPKRTESGMSILDHLDELRSRLFRAAIAYVVAISLCWAVSDKVLSFLLRPIREHLFEGDDITFINITEPFMIYVKASALIAVFVAAPYILYQLWCFVAPGLYKRERRMALPFLFFGSLFFLGGGAFGYYAAVPQAASWLIDLGSGYRASITLSSAFTFESRIILAMGLVFEMPIMIFFMARLGLVTPQFLLRNFKVAVLIIAVLAAVLTPTGDMVTMSFFVGPMVLLYLLGVGLAFLAMPKGGRKEEGS
jgi:sec-independent protein translocase protein TatC